MKVYDANHIRNVALVGHQGCGKTMLAEAMLYASGAIRRMGSIEAHSTVSDFHPSEHERQMSIFASLLHAEWEGHKINVIDTPGYPDFIGEVVSSLKVADTAIFVMHAGEGVQVGTELAWNYGEKIGKPSMFVINHMDKEEADFRMLVAQIKERFGHGATVVQIPCGPGTRAIIDVLLMKQLTFPEDGTFQVGEIAESFRAEAEELHTTLIEDIAENDEALMERYFDKGGLNEDEMRKGLHAAMLGRQLFPIFVTSATGAVGVSRLMNFIDNVLPPPTEVDTGESVVVDPSADPVAFVYKTMAEQHVGDYSLMRVYSGTLAQGMDLENAQTGTMERFGQLFAINGRGRDPVRKLVAGDLGAVVKLKNTHTNDTLHRKGSDVLVQPVEFPGPRYWVAIHAEHEGEEDKVGQGLHQLREEDPSLVIVHDPHLRQITLGGQGEMHLQVTRYRLERRFGVGIRYEKPRVAYRETITKRARASYRHKKQTGGAGQFADISMMVEPFEGDFEPPSDISMRGEAELMTDWGSKIHFVDAIVGGVIDMRRFFGAIQKGVLEATQDGPIAGYPVGHCRVVIYDGGMHAVDSNDAAFKTAGRMCFRDAFRSASPVILEPIYDVTITVPEHFVGEVLGDLNTRRGRIQGIEAEGVFQKIIAQVPESELYRYSTSLRSMTQGRGIHQAAFSRYEAMPRHVQEQVVEEAEGEAERNH